jgi:Glucose-6-phosphate dehydrogenase, NAD binding domain
VFFARGGFSPGNPGSLLDVLGEARTLLGDSPQLVHYLAVPPVAFGGLTQALGQHGLAHGARVVYEKPFGTSPGSFRELDRVVHSPMGELSVKGAGWSGPVTCSGRRAGVGLFCWLSSQVPGSCRRAAVSQRPQR